MSSTLTPTVDGSLFYHCAATGGDRLSTMAATSPQILLMKQQGSGGGRTYGVSADIERPRRKRPPDDMDDRRQRVPG